MDTFSATPQPLPRLRVSRASPSGRPDRGNASIASSSQAGPSRLTDFTQLVDLNLSDIRAAHDYTDEDEEQDQYPTPRMNNATPLAPSSATPTPSLAGRLRELIQLVPNGSGSQSTPTPHRPPSPTFHESDFEGESTTAGYSQARESLRGIFSKALREPGDTPQKGKQKTSDGGSSEVDSSIPRDWSGVKGKQGGLSDEESETPVSRGPHLIGSSQRTLLWSSRDSNAVEFPLKSISADDSDDAEDSPQPRRISPPDATSTPLQSLRISQNASFPQHSNLLDQDSEMQRAFGAFESFDEVSAQSQKSREPDIQMSIEPNVSTTPALLGRSATVERSKYTKPRLESHNPAEREQRRTSLPRPATPSLKHKTSSSLQFSDQSSVMSVSDYGERMKEMERERNREREREWNKRHPKSSRPGSSLSFHSPRPEHRSRTSSISSLESPRSGSALSNFSVDSVGSPQTRVRTMSGLSDRPRTVSGGNRPGSALSNDSTSVVDFAQGLRRHHSLTSGADSPVSSKSASSEIELERERNWNAPRPKWHRRSLPNTPDRPASPGPSKIPSHSSSAHRRERTTSSSALKDASNTSRSDLRSPIARRHSQSKATPLSPSPAERRNGVPTPSGNPSQSSRPHTITTSTPARPKSHIPRLISPNKQRSPLPSNRSHVETSKTAFEMEGPSEDKGAQETKSMVSFPQTVNDQYMSQESMELTEAYNAREAASAIPSFSDASHHISTPNNDTLHTASLLGPNNSQGTLHEVYDDEDNALAQERTPTLQLISPPPEESEFNEVQEPSLSTDQIHENFISVHEEPSFSGLQSTSANQSSIPSFLSTPPRSRQSPFNDSKPQFQTPSPPKGLPDLPGPPSSVSGDENERSLPQFTISLAPADVTPAGDMKSRYGNGDLTAFRTPKPPGSWLPTPGPSTRRRAQEDSTNGLVESSDDGLLKAKSRHSQSIFYQTPAPPGGWMDTPAARQADSDLESIINEGGLTTPAASLGRANTMTLKTPAPPGAWANTPIAGGAARKSVLKVRFNPEVTNEVNESSDVLPDSTLGQSKGSPGPPEPSSGGLRSTTPEPVTPITPPSRSPRKHKRSPSVRMVDAYGNEQKEGRPRKRDAPSPTPTTPRDKSGVRIVDALGQEVKEEPELSNEAAEDDGPNPVAPTNRMEALQRVRLGIQELAEGIESLELTSSPRGNDTARMKELDDTSRALKQSREQLAHNMHKAEKELRRQVRQKVVNANWLGRNVWFLFFVGVVQVLLIFMMYRASILRARKMFLTNYYDPFNPDLFLYTTNPDTQYATPAMSWNMVAQAVRGGDLTAFTGAFRTNLSILIKRWHQQIWDVWGDDPNRAIGAWPPT